MSKDWIIHPPWDGCTDAARQWNVPPLVAQLLYNRKVDCAEAATLFLAPQMNGLHPPSLLPGAVEAAGHIADAVRSGHKIVLYGDYDVDGITGVAILWHALKLAGADVSFYVPHRLEEGYGLNAAAVRSIAEDGAKLIVSIDCGITAIEEARVARELGVRLIVTDHHQPQNQLPDALTIVHPSLKAHSATGHAEPPAGHPSCNGGPGDGAYPNPHLCGAGVAFKVAWALAQNLCGAERVNAEYRKLLVDILALAAIGTVADVVPLVGENRIIARCGLACIQGTAFVGLRALLDVAGLNTGEIDGTAVGFQIAPRLNAAGRMGHARLAVDLLTWVDESRAREIALYLDEHNRARQTKQRRHAREIFELIERTGLDGDGHRAIVLAGDGWHLGVIGVVAAKVVDRYHKPAVLIAQSNGLGQGSARSVPYFPMHEALAACAEHLISHGGHSMAGGLQIRTDCIPAFTEAFNYYANNTLSGTACLPRLRIDGQVGLGELDERTVLAIGNLGPFGEGNPKPLFATDWVELADEPRCVGKTGEHLQVALSQQGVVLKGIAFGAAEHADQLKDHRRCRVAFEPIINEFKGRRKVEMQVVDFKFPGELPKG